MRGACRVPACRLRVHGASDARAGVRRDRLQRLRVNYADHIEDPDIVFEEKGIKVIFDPRSLEVIDGTQVDFVKEGLNEACRFRSPNVTGECGCGESFSV